MFRMGQSYTRRPRCTCQPSDTLGPRLHHDPSGGLNLKQRSQHWGILLASCICHLLQHRPAHDTSDCTQRQKRGDALMSSFQATKSQPLGQQVLMSLGSRIEMDLSRNCYKGNGIVIILNIHGVLISCHNTFMNLSLKNIFCFFI